MTRFWWVRHAPTHAKEAIGWTDRPADLSDTAALARLAAALPAEAPVLSSDLLRARQTAGAIAAERQRLPDALALRESHYGAWEGLSYAQIETRWPDLSRRYLGSPGAVAPPDGESWDALSARVVRAIEGLKDRAAPDLVLVSHMGPILAALAHATSLPPARALAFEIAPLSLTRLDWLPDPGVWRVGCVNHRP